MEIENVMKVLKCFPGSYMNYLGECILCEKGNVYFTVKNCETETDIKCKLLEWCSRSAGKGEPYRTEKKNIEFRQFVTNGINIYLGTDFTIEDMYWIYDKLGNAINHQLTLDFIANGYDMEFLKRSDGEMTKKERNEIIKFAEKLTDEELEKEYYNAVDSSLGSQCEDMYELGYDIADIVEREKYEKYLGQRADLLEALCEQRGIKLWERSDESEQ